MITRIKATNYRCFRDLDIEVNPGMNIIVGGNEAGKSTLLEVIAMAVTGRVRGRHIRDDISPYWVNREVVDEFFELRSRGLAPALPENELEVFFDITTPGAERLRGLHNSDKVDVPGLRVRVQPDPALDDEIQAYLSDQDLVNVLPTDLMFVSWSSFEGSELTRRPPGLAIAQISADVQSRGYGLDLKTRQLVRDFVTLKEAAAISTEHRRARASITTGVLSEVNQRIGSGDADALGIGLQMDQGADASWERSVTPEMAGIPFSYLGQGRQLGAQVGLAMSQSADTTHLVLVEEPESHLSHMELAKMLDAIDRRAEGRQMFVTTHSSFVLNRLGFQNLHLLHDGRCMRLAEPFISADTVSYFQRQSGFDTLRVVLANKVVVVEGPSDEMIFNLAFAQTHEGREPRSYGIDVLAQGARGKRVLELAAALGRPMAVLRDNDDQPSGHWEKKVSEYLKPGHRQMFVGKLGCGRTLETQILHSNGPELLREVLGLGDDDPVEAWMLDNKTEAAWRIVQHEAHLTWPDYICEAIGFIDGV